jgi:hypothetical protein
MSSSTRLVTGTDFVFVPIRNLPAADEFYGTVLGLTCSKRYERIAGAEYETGTSRSS